MILEELLNKLIEKGWKPNGDDVKCFMEQYDPDFGGHIWSAIINEDRMEHYTYRRLTSKESGLWQFVCENDYWVHKDTYFVEKYTDHIAIHLYQCNDYRYWLLGSALKDESELEQFLLDNIKIGGQ